MKFRTIEFFDYLSKEEILEGKGAYWKDGQVHVLHAETSIDILNFAHSEETIDAELENARAFVQENGKAFINYHETK